MRNKFSEWIEAGIASFHPTPIAPETPEQDALCRVYNNMWGMATDTHMSIVDGLHTITGSLISHDEKWINLLYATRWGGLLFTSTNGHPTSLSGWMASVRLKPKCDTVNGDRVIRLYPDTDLDLPCEITDCPQAACTTESKFPQPLAFYLGNPSKFLDCILENHTLNDICSSLNQNPQVPGQDWHICEHKLVGNVNGRTLLVDLNYKLKDDENK